MMASTIRQSSLLAMDGTKQGRRRPRYTRSVDGQLLKCSSGDMANQTICRATATTHRTVAVQSAHRRSQQLLVDGDDCIYGSKPTERPPFRHALMPRSETSLDSVSDLSYDSDEDYRLAQQEWEESMQELQQLALVLLLPWVGKFLGRKTSYWLYDRYKRVGLGRTFFLGDASRFFSINVVQSQVRNIH